MSTDNEPYVTIVQNVTPIPHYRLGVVEVHYSAQQVARMDFEALRLEDETLTLIHGITSLGHYENRIDLRNVIGVEFTYNDQQGG